MSLLDALAKEIALEQKEENVKDTSMSQFKSIKVSKSNKMVEKYSKDEELILKKMKSLGLNIPIKKLYDSSKEVEYSNILPLSLIKSSNSVASTIGIIYALGDPQRSVKGKSFCKWKLTDFKNDIEMLFFSDLKKLSTVSDYFAGIIVLIDKPKLSKTSKNTFIINSLSQLRPIGEAKVTFCSTKTCHNIMRSSKVKFCNLHLTKALEKTRSVTPMFSSGLSYSLPKQTNGSIARVLKRLRRGELKIKPLSAEKSQNIGLNLKEYKKKFKSSKENINWNEIKNSKSQLKAKLENMKFDKTLEKLNKLEAKEAIQERMNEINEFKILAFACKNCKLLLEKPLDKCTNEKHRIIQLQVTKRFFKCVQCSNRINTLNKRFPKDKCFNCRNVIWKRCSAYKDNAR